MFQNLHLGFRGGRLRRDQVRRIQNDAQAWAVYVGKEPRGKLGRVQCVDGNRLNADPCADLFGVCADLPRKIEQTGIGGFALRLRKGEMRCFRADAARAEKHACGKSLLKLRLCFRELAWVAVACADIAAHDGQGNT